MIEPLVLETHRGVRLVRMTSQPRRGNPLSRDLTRRLLDEVLEAECNARNAAVVLAVGRAIAADMILTGRVITGDAAARLGIAARAVVSERVLDEVMAVAAAIGERSPASIRFAREELREAGEGHLRQSPRNDRLLAAVVLDTEKKQQVGAFATRAEARRAEP